jgi:hypothetical protein
MAKNVILLIVTLSITDLMLDIFYSNDWSFKLCHFGSGIDWCCHDEVEVLPWYRFRQMVASASHSSFPTSLPKITQHIITTKVVVHGNKHAITEFLLLLSVGSLVALTTRGAIMPPNVSLLQDRLQ